MRAYQGRTKGDGEITMAEKNEQTHYRILGVTACPTGIAHTYMAAEAIAKKGDELGIPVKVETQGSVDRSVPRTS